MSPEEGYGSRYFNFVKRSLPRRERGHSGPTVNEWVKKEVMNLAGEEFSVPGLYEDSSHTSYYKGRWNFIPWHSVNKENITPLSNMITAFLLDIVPVTLSSDKPACHLAWGVKISLLIVLAPLVDGDFRKKCQRLVSSRQFQFQCSNCHQVGHLLLGE